MGTIHKYKGDDKINVSKKKQVNNNIYYQAHQINMLKSIREHKELDSRENVKEESLEEIRAGDDEDER